MKWISIIPIILFCGCAEVQEVATTVVSDPNVVEAVKATGQAAVTAVGVSYPEVAVVVTAGIALAEAIKALAKKQKEAK